jgi:hypothetical protein
VTTLIVAFCIGIVAGLRTFTPMAALLLARGGIWAIAGIPAVLSAGLEFVSDIQPAATYCLFYGKRKFERRA